MVGKGVAAVVGEAALLQNKCQKQVRETVGCKLE